MNNRIILDGYIRNIEFSHSSNGIEYSKAQLICKREDSPEEDLINLKFKTFTNNYKENDFINLTGNIRSYSRRENGKNKVDIYVFTYFDKPSDVVESNNEFILEGTICKTNELRKTQKGSYQYQFILANNLLSKETHKKLNSYLPMVAFNDNAEILSRLPINTELKIKGRLQSREYKKKIDNSVEIKIAHELIIREFEVI